MAWRKAKRAAGEALETAGGLVDAHERIGAWFGALAGVLGGVLLWIGPGTMGEEIPIHRQLGVAAGAFGVVMFLSLILKGNAGYRARSLLMAMLATLIGGLLAWWIHGTAFDIWALHEEGEVRTVEVVGSTMKYDSYNRTTTRRTQVSIDGKHVSVDLGGSPRRGERASVLVAPSRPEAIVPGHVERDWLSLIDELVGRWTAVIVLAIAIFCALAVPKKLWDVLTGPPVGVDPDEDI